MVMIFAQGFSLKPLTPKFRRHFSFLESSPFSLLMSTPLLARSVHDLVQKYDIWFLDQFGVLHDGLKCNEGALEAVALLRKQGKKVIVVSNSSARSVTASFKLRQLGFPEGSFDYVATSGECAHSLLKTFGERKCLLFTWNNLTNSILGETDIELSSVDTADFLLFHGTQIIASADSDADIDISSVYDFARVSRELDDLLNTAIRRRLPAVCANVDIQAVTPTGAKFMPGVLADEYRRRGGEVIAFGKPDPTFFHTALMHATTTIGAGTDASAPSNELIRARGSKTKMIHVGDSLQHDIAGEQANETQPPSCLPPCCLKINLCKNIYKACRVMIGATAFNIDSLLITGHGIHREVLHAAGPLPPTDLEAMRALLFRVCDLCDAEGRPRPTYIMDSFTV